MGVRENYEKRERERGQRFFLVYLFAKRRLLRFVCNDIFAVEWLAQCCVSPTMMMMRKFKHLLRFAFGFIPALRDLFFPFSLTRKVMLSVAYTIVFSWIIYYTVVILRNEKYFKIKAESWCVYSQSIKELHVLALTLQNYFFNF